MRIFKAVRAFVGNYWLSGLLYGAVILAFGWLLWNNLGTLTHGYSTSEAAALQGSSNLRAIFDNPINAPFKLLVHGLSYMHSDGLILTRIAATIIGLFTISVFYWLVRYWHGQRAAIFGTIVFGTSAWFLHTARLGTPDVLMFLLLSLAACGVWFKHSRSPLPVLLCLVLASALLYVPGMIWFIGASVIWQWKTIDRVFKKHLWMVTLGGFLLLGMLVPLALSVYHDPHIAKVYIGLPMNGWPNPIDVAKNILEVPIHLLLRGPNMPEHWLGHIPILDGFCIAMLFLGGYAYLKHPKLVRMQLLAVIMLVGVILISLGGDVSLSIIMPFVYIVVAAGIGLLLDHWFKVFPKNPIAQNVGIGLAGLVVLSSCWYGYRQYYVAWPNNSETKAVFTVDPKSLSDTIKE